MITSTVFYSMCMNIGVFLLLFGFFCLKPLANNINKKISQALLFEGQTPPDLNRLKQIYNGAFLFCIFFGLALIAFGGYKDYIDKNNADVSIVQEQINITENIERI